MQPFGGFVEKEGNVVSYNDAVKCEWGLDNDEEVEITRQLPVNSVKCVDCGKRIEWNAAHGFAAVEHRVQPTQEQRG